MTILLQIIGENVFGVNLSFYDGFIFDMDGTLLDTMPAHLAAWKVTAEHFDFPFDLNGYIV